MLCQAHLGEVKAQLDAIRARGAEVVVVTPSRSEDLRDVLAGNPQPFPMVGDPEREAYRAFGLARGKARMFLSPRIIGHYLSRMWAGWKVRKPRRGEDLLQLGGDFVLDSSRRLTFAYRSVDPTDRPSVQQLLDAIPQASPAS
ncbi:MAG: AhpC/TSA family protein [Gemmatales bacterium]